MARLAHHFDHAARELQVALYRLVAVGGRADIEQARHIARLGKLLAQHLRNVVLGHDLRLKVEPGGKIEVTMRGPRVAVDAAVLTAPVGIDR